MLRHNQLTNPQTESVKLQNPKPYEPTPVDTPEPEPIKKPEP
jgi:hypothetical protein